MKKIEKTRLIGLIIFEVEVKVKVEVEEIEKARLIRKIAKNLRTMNNNNNGHTIVKQWSLNCMLTYYN